MEVSLSDELQQRMDAYWRAANYLSVGQIYLYDNPLLKEPLRPEHIKPRLLGHWGTTPGLNFIYVHLNRLINAARPEHDLHHRARARRAGPGGQHLSGRHLQRGLSRTSRRTNAGMKRLFKQFSFPGRHSQPRRAGNARLDPRRRRTGLLAVARLRRGVRQSRPARRLRGRRRRGRDRPAGHQLALEQVPQPGPRRRRAADPAPERLQDRRPDRAGAHQPRGAGRSCSAATATSRYFVEGRRAATPMHQLMAATLDRVRGRDPRRSRRDAREQRLHASGRAGR